MGSSNAGSIVIDGKSLTCGQVATVARGEARVVVGASALSAAQAAWLAVRDLAAERPVYGRNTGVGANASVDVGSDPAEHGLRLLRSHATGAGPLIATEYARAMLVVRLNQLGAGGAGVDPALLGVLADVINRGFTPPVPMYGAIGTGDLTALALTGLCLLGEQAWRSGEGSPPRYRIEPADALALISSNAETLGEAALACSELAGLLRSAVVIAALSLLAVNGSHEPYAEAVHHACPHPGQQAVAASVRSLITAERHTSPRVQDPYGYRAFPQVHGPALDALGYADGVITRELNSASENPLVDVAGHAIWHNGNFHAAYAGLALDALRAALFQTAALSAARLGTLVEPSFTGLNAFQADSAAGSGIMLLEYVAQSAVADIRRFAAPAALGNAVLSRGVEEHAGFSTQSARATGDAVAAYRVVLACELVAAVRALRMQGRAPSGDGLRQAFDIAAAALDPSTQDRPLERDLASSAAILAVYSPLCP